MSQKKLSSGNTKGTSNFLEILKDKTFKVINRTCGMFSAITLLICFFGVLQNKNIAITCGKCGDIAGEFPGGMLNSTAVMWFAVFSLSISIISLIVDFMKKKNVNYVITMSVHFVLAYISFFFIFIKGELFTLYSDSVMFTGNSPWITGFALTIFFIGAYLLIYGVRFLWYFLSEKRKSKKSEYKNIYTDSDESNEDNQNQ